MGEKLTNLKSTSVGLYHPTLTSALDTAQPKSSCLKQTLFAGNMHSLGHRAKNLTNALAVGTVYREGSLDWTGGNFPLRERTHDSSHPISHNASFT